MPIMLCESNSSHKTPLVKGRSPHQRSKARSWGSHFSSWCNQTRPPAFPDPPWHLTNQHIPDHLEKGVNLSMCALYIYIYIKYMNHMSSEVRRPRMDLARAFAGTALALSSLERELGPSTPYCAVAAWHLEPWSFFLGLLAGLVLLPLLEIFLALRAWLVGTLAARASSGGNTRPLYKLC